MAAFDTSGLCDEWDQCDEVRERLRRGESLFIAPKSKGADATIPECTQNSDLLFPPLHRLFRCQLKLPDISGLREEVQTIYSKNQRGPQDDEIDDAAWDIRKMLRLIKRKANRDDPSLDTWHYMHCIFRNMKPVG
jgi:hypothetical protein